MKLFQIARRTRDMGLQDQTGTESLSQENASLRQDNEELRKIVEDLRQTIETFGNRKSKQIQKEKVELLEENHLLCKKITSLQEENQKLNQQVLTFKEKFNNQLEHLKKQHEVMEEQSLKLQNVKVDFEKEREDSKLLRDQVGDLKRKLAFSNNKLNQKTEKVRELEEKLEGQTLELQATRFLLDGSEYECRFLRDVNTSLSEKNKELEEKLKHTTLDLEKSQENVEVQKMALDQSVLDYHDACEKISSLECQTEKFIEVTSALMEDSELLEENVEQLTEKLTTNQVLNQVLHEQVLYLKAKHTESEKLVQAQECLSQSENQEKKDLNVKPKRQEKKHFQTLKKKCSSLIKKSV
ncbi:protein CROWDED NUCLEI 2 [Nothobranchius furzeri]|uniref:Protein CROWDED NUCLEI 2 n=1 Tax=Nothobranchius furzeri TaxID=105023 RepID=A0A9D3BND1_NOTFU|nr:protein CROWDED NUCLEI 2 [Nothobranchius furzeri]